MMMIWEKMLQDNDYERRMTLTMMMIWEKMLQDNDDKRRIHESDNDDDMGASK